MGAKSIGSEASNGRERSNQKEHWERVYGTRSPTEMGWYEPRLEVSLRLVEQAGIRFDDPIVDVGGGASTLVDDLLARGYTDITVLDVSSTALEVAKERLGPAAKSVRWICADVREVDLGGREFVVWHDRAAFHFLTDEGSRTQYRRKLDAAVVVGGAVIMGVFGPSAPPLCSGLPVRRHAPGDIARFLGDSYSMERVVYHRHRTPSGVEQPYVYCLFRRRSA